MKKMTSKDLHVALKNQATEEELMERYGGRQLRRIV